MIVHRDLQQGTVEWRGLRAGKICASEVHVLMTKRARTGELTEGSRTYLYRLLAEWATGQPYETADSAFMRRGSELEDRAWATYEFDHNVTTEKVGGVESDDRRLWCSPDRLIGAEGGGELKILSAPNHVRALLEADDEHLIQVQANLWITGRHWWDLYFWNPVMPEVCRRIGRDDDFIGELSASVELFFGHLEAGKERLRSLGVVPGAPTDFTALKSELATEASDFDAIVAASRGAAEKERGHIGPDVLKRRTLQSAPVFDPAYIFDPNDPALKSDDIPF